MGYNGSIWPIKGCIVWSKLKEDNSNNKKNSLLIYRAGIRITSASNEIREIIKFIEQGRKTAETQQYFSLSLDKLDIRGKHRNNVESLHSIFRVIDLIGAAGGT